MAESISVDDLPASPACSRILAALARQSGLTRKELAAAAYVGETTLSGGGYLRQLRQQRLIHISGWRRSASGSFSIPQFSLGAGPDFPRPTINLSNRAAAGMERLVEVIRSGGADACRPARRLARQGRVELRRTRKTQSRTRRRHAVGRQRHRPDRTAAPRSAA